MGSLRFPKRKKGGTQRPKVHQTHSTMQHQKLTLAHMKGDLGTYFNFAINALFPVYDGADGYLIQHQATIRRVAQKLLQRINYQPEPLFRGILLKQPVTQINPHPNLTFLPFSTDRAVAAHFANPKGFGSNVMNVELHLGKYGYVIEYTPELSEILFHYRFLSFLPFVEALNLIKVDGHGQVEFLKKQKEVTILQPDKPFLNITAQF